VQPFLLALVQIRRPGFGNGRQTVFIGRCKRIQAFAQLSPFGRPPGALPLQQARHLAGPAEVILRQHRQVEQPFTGVIDDFKVQRRSILEVAHQGFIRAKAQREANFTHPSRRRRPRGRIAIELRQPFVIGKAWNTKITLRTRFTPSRRSSRTALSSGRRARRAGSGAGLPSR
jgi:hypothetical protein